MAEVQREYTFWSNWKCMLACLLIAMAPFQYGVDFGLIGGMQAMVGFLQVFGYRDPATPVGWNISTGVQQLISSLMTLGAFFGSLLAGPMATKLGRKQSLWIACVLCIASNAIMMGTTKLAGLYVGRLFIGIANGFLMTFSQLYLQEVSPARYRGMALAFFQIWCSVGSLIGVIGDNFTAPLPGRKCYLIPLGIIYIVPAIVGAGMFFIPESPRWLVSQNKIEEARKALYWLRPDHSLVEQELKEMEIAVETERMTTNGTAMSDMFRNPIDRRRTLLAVGAVSTQAACGVMYMLSYGTYFFEMANVGKPFMNSCIIAAVGLVAIIINLFIVAPFGRRRLLLVTGLIICGFCQLIIAIVYTKSPGTPSTGKVIVGFSVLYVFVYNGSIASIAWLSGGELPSQRLRSYTFGLAAAIGFLGGWVAAFTAPYFINPASLNWGPKYGYIWFVSSLFTAAVVFLYLPELKNRTLEEIDEMFEARLPARKFRGYQCVVTEVAKTKIEPTEAAQFILEKQGIEAEVRQVEDVRSQA